MSNLTVSKVEQAVRDGVRFAKFSDGALVPVTPQVGQWFCEFEIEGGIFDDAWVRDGALVEYVGEGRVCEGRDYSDRLPAGDVLVLQA